MNPAKCELSDNDWDLIQKVLPDELYTGVGSLGGRPHSNLRNIFCGILFYIRSGCQWDLILRVYGSRTTLAKYLDRWVEGQVFEKLMALSLELYDQEVGIEWKFQSIDGSMKRATGCSENAEKTLQTGLDQGQSRCSLPIKMGSHLPQLPSPQIIQI